MAGPTSTQYADNLERVLFNAILAVRPPDSDGDYSYYSTYSADATRVFYSKEVAVLLRHSRPDRRRLSAQYLP